MGNAERLEPISEAEVRTFTAKLQAWAERLPPKEQALLNLMLEQAHAAEGLDTAGYGMLGAQNLTFQGAAERALLPLIPHHGFNSVANWASAPKSFR